MAKLWKAGPEVYEMMTELVANYHPHLAICDDEIAIVFKEKAKVVTVKDGEQDVEICVPGTTGKGGGILQALADKDYKFIITLAADVWQEMSDEERKALLDHHLCAMGVEENAETGAIKYFIRPPEFVFYAAEVQRHGFWRVKGKHQDGSTPLKQIFGDKPVPEVLKKLDDMLGADDNPLTNQTGRGVKASA